jgi:hypothetical protein
MAGQGSAVRRGLARPGLARPGLSPYSIGTRLIARA